MVTEKLFLHNREAVSMKRKMFTRTLIFLLFILLSTPISAAPTPRNVQLKKNKKISITVLKNQKITLKAASKFNWSSSNKKIAIKDNKPN